MNPPLLVSPQAPAVVAGAGRAAILLPDGELLSLSSQEAGQRVGRLDPPLLVHAPATLRWLGLPPMPAYDLLELFAFVLPAQGAAPTPLGLALALGLNPPGSGLAAAAMLPDIAMVLMRRLTAGRHTALNREAAGLAALLDRAGWLWAPYVLAALGEPHAAPSIQALKIWKSLPEWEETGPLPAPSAHPVTEAQARRRLAEMLGPEAEHRPGQADYAGAAAAAFAPRAQRGQPHLVLAEAGTGTGKTLGYIAPASVWAEFNNGAVWISTFTRHLQRQIDAELGRLFPDLVERRRRVVVRKGRENYLCLLNLEDAVVGAGGMAYSQLLLLALVTRWAIVTSDGDIQGGDLPGWMAELFGPAPLFGLADRRGECIHAACPHWRCCFVEHTIRRARTAHLVIGNHALVMAQAAWGGLDEAEVPTRYVFDEGHHVFDAADSAFSAVLSGVETAELRRWLLGAEGGRSRARGLRRRLDELVIRRPDLETHLDMALQAARALPAPGWSMRLTDPIAKLAGADTIALNPAEAFLRLLRRQVLARLEGDGAMPRGTHEADLFPTLDDLPDTARVLARSLARIAEPLIALRKRLAERLDAEAETMDAATRNRIEATCRSLQRRAIDPLNAWQAMLRTVVGSPPEPGKLPLHVYFVRLDRREAGDRDVGLHRHWLDPTMPFATVLAAPAHGLLLTSATLRDAGAGDAEAAWVAAEERVGAQHLAMPAIRAGVASPFDYATQTRAFVVTDLAAGDPAALAAAYRELFIAAGGGALGLFTAINRLREVHTRIAPALEAAGIPLFAQHVDPMDNATLIDIFRTEEGSCLLGTDAMRDGVDVPGRALRLVVFEKTPWPRPDILHRERRMHLSGGNPGSYDDRAARLRLRQAFGRLIRRADDRGVFVLLDRRAPTRLLTAFPAGVTVRRIGLAEAVAETTEFLTVPGDGSSHGYRPAAV